MKRLVMVALLLSFNFATYSQVPQGFNYQSVIRNSSGQPIANQSVKIHILLTDQAGTLIHYSEVHSITTSSLGVANVTIGKGTPDQGSFDAVPWQSGDVYFKVEVDPTGGTNYQSTGSPVKFYSVPYALFADNTKEIVSQPSAGDDDPIFVVKNKAGQIVFAVYQTGVRVFVEDSPIVKGAKGGFAVGGLTNQAKGGPAEYLRITSDSARIYINQATAKGAKGGFAVGGLTNQAKTVVSQNIMYIAPDSTRIYVNENVAKGAKGGFAVGGLTNQGKGSANNYMQLTPDNYFIGHQSGSKTTTGLYNSFFGYQTGSLNTTGSSNIFIGYLAGYSNNADNNVFLGNESGRYNTIGTNNAFMGYFAGRSNTTGSSNVFIGNQSGNNNISGSSNVFIGDSVGPYNTSGDKNVFLGNFAGKNNIFGANNVYIGYQAGYLGNYGSQNICIGNYSGYSNTSSQNLFIGEYAGEKNTSGTRNSFVGFFAGQENITGGQNSYFGQFAGMDNTKSFNTFIGYWSGGLNVNGANNAFLGYRSGQGSSGSNNVFLGFSAGEGNTGTGNIMIGYQAGYNSGAKSNALYIANSSTSTPLIGGDFTNGRLGINRMPTTYALEVAGTIWANGSTITAGASTWSDARFKTNIITISNALSGICNLRGVTYDWDNSNNKTLNFPKGKQIGVIAQEVEKVFPELVSTDEDGYKSVAYEKLSAILVEAMKEQQKLIDEQKRTIETLSISQTNTEHEMQQLKSELNTLKEMIDQLKK